MKGIRILCGFAILILLSYCKKDDVEIVITSDYKNFLQDEADINNYMDDIDNESEDAENSVSIKKSAVQSDTGNLSGRTINFSFDGKTRVYTISYTNFDHPITPKSRILNGKIILKVTGLRLLKNYKRVVEFENFKIDSVKIEGTKTVEQLDSLKYRITLTNGKITFAGGASVTHSYNKTRTMTAGFLSPLFIWDDVYSFEGTAEGVNKKGMSYTKTIVKPVILLGKFWCPVEGSFDMIIKGEKINLDYGNGATDTKATVTIKGITQEISLR